MHPGLQEIADRFKVPLSSRSCTNSFSWDGKTLALNFQREIQEEFRYPYSLSDLKYHLSEMMPLPDEWIAHELAHWVVADPVEREFPEYGCAIGGLGFGANGNLPWTKTTWGTREWFNLVSISDGVLRKEEQSFREVCADILGTYWCDLLGIRVEENGRPLNKIIASINDPDSPYSIEEGYKAVIWLREKGLIP